MYITNNDIYTTNEFTLKGKHITFTTQDIHGQYLSKILFMVKPNDVTHIQIYKTDQSYNQRKLIENYSIQEESYFVLPGFGCYIVDIISKKPCECKIKTFSI